MILVSLLKKDFKLFLIDANGQDLSEASVMERLQTIHPEIAMVSALSFEYAQQSHKTFALIKQVCPEAITVIGGVHPTLMPEEVIRDKNIDFLFLGHAQERIHDFLKAVLSRDEAALQKMPGIAFRQESGKDIINPVETFTADVKTMVKPDYSLIDLTHYLTTKDNLGSHHLASDKRTAAIITSYGCPYNCIFCANPILNNRKVAFRPIEDVLEEIEYLVRQYQVEQFIFTDDCFLLKKERVKALFTAFIDRGHTFSWKTTAVPAWLLDKELLQLMKKSGCTQISISVESGVPRVLHDIIRKPLDLKIVPQIVRTCKEVGIDLGANFVFGFPGETWDEIRQTIRYAEACDFDVVHFHVAVPYPQTDLYKIAKQDGLLPVGFDFKHITYTGHAQGYITTEEFTPEELMVLRAYEWDRINFRSEEKTKKIAEMYKLSMRELNQHRKATRLNLGIIKHNIAN